jgi:hypothetical protein
MLFRNERMLPFRVQREDDSLLTLPRTLYYCLGNIEAPDRSDPMAETPGATSRSRRA